MAMGHTLMLVLYPLFAIRRRKFRKYGGLIDIWLHDALLVTHQAGCDPD